MVQKSLKLSNVQIKNVEDWLKKIKTKHQIDSKSLATGLDKYFADIGAKDCHGSCGASCVSTCNYSCNNNCTDSCHGTCKDTCQGTCSGTLGFKS